MAVKLESFEEDALYPRMQSDINMNQSHHNFQADFRNHLAVDSSISSYHSNMSHQKYLKTKERNRIHARKSRERQKNLINTLQTEMGMLQKEFHRLRGLVMGNNLTPLSELDVEGDGEISLGDDKAMEIFTLQGDYTLPNPQPDSGMIDAHKLRYTHSLFLKNKKTLKMLLRNKVLYNAPITRSNNNDANRRTSYFKFFLSSLGKKETEFMLRRHGIERKTLSQMLTR